MKPIENMARRGSALVVDDEPVNRSLMTAYLRRLGFARIDTASDGREALSSLSGHCPDIVFTDLNMPQMTGSELIAQIQQREGLRKLPVVLFTSEEFNSAEWGGLGFADYLNKPFSRDEVGEALARLGF